MLTSNVASWIYTKLTAVIIVIIHTVSNWVRVATIAFSPIDCLNSCAESLPGCNSRVAIAIQHPKPDSSLPWNWIILSYNLRVIQPIESQVISGGTIIIIPAELLTTKQQMVSHQTFNTDSNSLNTMRVKSFIIKLNWQL